MKKWMLMFLCLISCTGKMDTIGNVQYQPPKELSKWEKNEMSENGMQGTKYTHSEEGVEQMFITTYLAHPEMDAATKEKLSSIMEFNQERVDQLQTELKKKLEMAFPNQKVTMQTIDMEPTSLFYEWTISDQDGKVISHSWERIFSTADGKTSLYYGFYLRSPSAKIPDTDPWVKTLQNAKLSKR